MNINVPAFAIEHFWEEPPAYSEFIGREFLRQYQSAPALTEAK